MSARGIGLAGFWMLAATTALARDANGLLDRIVTPNSGVPALALDGGNFEAACRDRASLALVSGDIRVVLDCAWRAEGGLQKALCSIPPGTEPGMYALEGGGDVNTRAVFVYRSFPGTYAVAHLTDPHVGSNAHTRPAAAILGDIVAHANASGAAFVAVTGDLTEHGTAEEFKEFIGAMEACDLPSFVTPGTNDRGTAGDRVYEQFFGPPEYAFRFGEDGYLAFDTSRTAPTDDLGPEAGIIERLRRDIKSARWQAGLTYRYTPAMGMRAQLALFVDTPLDFLLFGSLHRENATDEVIIPWGHTLALTGPAALDGGLRYIDVKPGRPFPRATEIVAPVE